MDAIQDSFSFLCIHLRSELYVYILLPLEGATLEWCKTKHKMIQF